MNIGKMLKQAQQMQAQLQEEMEQLKVEATAGGGMVTARMNGKKQLLTLEIKPEVAKGMLNVWNSLPSLLWILWADVKPGKTLGSICPVCCRIWKEKMSSRLLTATTKIAKSCNTLSA